jgi:RNA 2',3'-cyclic 3'-phosphodiesterase
VSRLFLAVWPPPEIIERIEALPRDKQHGVRWLASSNWHVTLRFFGEANEDDVAARLNSTVLTPASGTVGPAVARLGHGVVVVPIDGLEALARALVDVTADVGKPPSRRRFSGHVTIARLRDGARCDLVGTPISGGFDVGEVLLVRSTLHRAGARYDIVGRWPLGERC